MSGHLLILLVPVLSLCGATEYYVRPTEPTNTSCPAQPCLTLSQYTSDSDHYFKSNTVFKFLPGTHHMDRPLTIGNVHNMSLESLSDESNEYPHLVAQLSCETEEHECIYITIHQDFGTQNFQVCCAAVWLHDVYNVTVKGISITVQTSDKHISVVILKNVSGTTVQLNATCSLTDDTSNGANGIIMYEATSVEVHSSSANNCSYGLVLHNTTNTHIAKVTAMYNDVVGIALRTCTDTNIYNTVAAHNGQYGMLLGDMSNTHITNTTTAYNGWCGMSLVDMNNTHITNMTTAHNRDVGMNLHAMNNTHITNTTTAYNDWNGMILVDMNNTHITNMTTAHNGYSGIWLEAMNNTHITNMTTAHNGDDGMYLEAMNNTHITNMTTAHNRDVGMNLHAMNNTHITNTTTAYNDWNGMILVDMNNTHITNMTTAHNGYSGIWLEAMNNTHITNMTTAHNGDDGMYLEAMNNTHITNTTTAYNDDNGMRLADMNNTHITNTTTAYNDDNGMRLADMNNTHITNMTTAHNGDDGMYLEAMNNTHITNTTTAYNDDNGMRLADMNNTHITNTTTAYNDDNGMRLADMNNTHITNMTTAHNGDDGMYLEAMNNTHITNTTTAYNDDNGMRLADMNNTHITNTTTAYNDDNGMRLADMNNTHITNMTTAHNGYSGIWLQAMNNTHITNTTVTQNSRSGIYLYKNNNTYMTKTTATHNGCLLYFWDFHGQVVMINSINTVIYNTSFTDVSAQCLYSPSTTLPGSLPAVIALYRSMLVVSDCDFTRNNVSALAAYASNITVSGGLTFSNNTAFAGTAFILIKDSILTSAENSHIYFLNNHATNIGGVFYIASNSVYLFNVSYGTLYPRSTCFLNIEGSRFHSRFTFANNSAGIGGDILYGGEVAFGLDGEWNCLESFKNISNISQNGLSVVSSDPLRVCLCNETGQPDCPVLIDPKPYTIYPGQTINISAVVVGQNFGTVAGSAYAHFLQEGCLPQLKPEQKVQSVTQRNCSNLSYTIFSQGEASEAVLVLTVQDSYVSQFFDNAVDEYAIYAVGKEYSVSNESAVETLLYSINFPVYVNVSILPCPPGFMLTTASPFKCDCDQLLQEMPAIHCHIQEHTIGRSGLLWVGMIQDDNGTNGTVAASEYCSMDYCNAEDSNVTLSEPDSQCNYNHSGTLCGGCQPGLSLALGSAQCLQCSNKYLALLIPLTLAGPVLVFSIKLLDLTISQGTLNGLIFYANVVKANEHIFLPPQQTNPLTVFIAWLNLDLGVETCLFQGLTAYSKTWLQFVFPFYIWSIAGLIIILAKYSDRVAKVMGNNSVPVLATLFLLSYAKLLRTIITAVSYTIVYTSHGPKAVWTADGNVDYLGPKHAPLFTTAVAVLLFLWLPYTLLLFLGQWLHRCNCRLVGNMLIKIKPFLDAHYGPVKSKHHYWFGALLLVRATILLISALIPANRSSVVVLCVSVFAVVLTHFGHMVYRNLAVAMFDIAFFMNLALLTGATSFIATAGGELAMSAYTLIGIAFVLFAGLVLFKVFSILKQSEKVMEFLRKKQIVEDDWELYEQAALEREMESDAEEQESEGSGSIESLPTY